MPTVRFGDRTLDCAHGATLRSVLRSNGASPHNGRSQLLNCHGLGSCGTCAVRVTGAVSEPTRRERLRLTVPPHDSDSGLRLACQTRVLGDVTVEKFPGFWGQHVEGGGAAETDEKETDESGTEDAVGRN